MILDTDILSAVVSPRCPPRIPRELERASGALQTTTVNWGEICYGLARHPAGAGLRDRYERLVLPLLDVLDFDVAAAEIYGRLRAELETKGERLAEADLLIGSIALRHRVPLVSGNVRHFSRIPGLTVLNWFE
jgi:tRNA(fMet)-specific endonuclease VapC